MAGNKKLIRKNVYVKKSPTHGYGVFAGEDFRKGTILEECYFILTKGGDDVLDDYYFDAGKQYAFFLGYGSIYNHDDEPNADYVLNKKRRIATITAERTIKKGEEITVSYGDEWFKDRDMVPKKAKKRKK